MKEYRSVRARASEDNYKKGVNRIDTKSGFYKVGKILYYIAFAWFMLFQFVYIFANTAAFGTLAAAQVELFYYFAFIIIFVALAAGFVFLKLSWHVPFFCLNTAGCIAEISVLNGHENVSLAFLEKGFLSNPFFWKHYAPAILIILFSAIITVIAVKSYVHQRNDYKNAMAAMYQAYCEEHGQISDVEWQKHLEKLDAEMAEERKNGKKGKKKA